MKWINTTDEVPKPLQTVLISNGKGWTALGCLIGTNEGYHWAESIGLIYGEMVS
jgi:hypothetical protein